MLPILHTPRLFLRPWDEGDLDSIHKLFIDPAVRRYLWDNQVIEQEQASNVLKAHLENVQRHRIGYWSIQESPRGHMLGFCGFRLIPGDEGEIELMYGLLPLIWGQGMATEACRSALDYFWQWTQFPRVWARTDPPNEKSIATMARLGFQHYFTTNTMVTYLLERPTP